MRCTKVQIERPTFKFEKVPLLQVNSGKRTRGLFFEVPGTFFNSSGMFINGHPI